MFSLDDLKSAGSKLKSVNIKNQKAFNQNANGKHLKTGIHAFKLRKGKFSWAYFLLIRRNTMEITLATMADSVIVLLLIFLYIDSK